MKAEHPAQLDAVEQAAVEGDLQGTGAAHVRPGRAGDAQIDPGAGDGQVDDGDPGVDVDTLAGTRGQGARHHGA